MTLESFVWEPWFVTGLEAVDEQHRGLVDLINRYGALIVRPEGADASQIRAVVDELAHYADFHFREEETLMAEVGLAAEFRAHHQREHAGFLGEAVRLLGAADGHRATESRVLLNFLVDWLAYHILGTDQVMARQIAAIRAGATPADAWRAVQHGRDPATATLLQSLDRLFQQVSERNRALHDLNLTLEARVAERTHELLEANNRLEEMALTDALTGLGNRRQALRTLQAQWQHASKSGRPLACIMIDADDFKGVNDRDGHDTGDAVLRELARRLSDAVRTDDTICRLGGDEFLVICGDTPREGALQLAEALREQVAYLRVPTPTGVWVGSISAGVAQRDASMRHVEDLLKAADHALYVAKRDGRNRVATASV